MATDACVSLYKYSTKMNQMNSRLKNVLRYIVGYVLGICVFIVLIPYSIWYLSSSNYILFRIPIISMDYVCFIISVPLFIIGIVFVVWSNVFLLFKGKGGPMDIAGISVAPRTKSLVVDGPYQYTRNPMVFGTNSTYLSLTIYFNSLGCLIVLVMFYLVVVKYVVTTEEKRLLNDFGDDYKKYKEETPMVIPLLRKKAIKS